MTGLREQKVEAFLFYFLIFGTVAFSRDFAWLHLRLGAEPPYVQVAWRTAAEGSLAAYAQGSGLPVFITEILLTLILVAITVRRWRQKLPAPDRSPLDLWLGLWCLVGLLEFSGGAFGSGSLLLALRDLGMVYYVVFFYVAREILSTWMALRLLLVVLVAATALRIAISCWYYVFHVNFSPEISVNWPALGRYMSGTNGASILVVVLIGMALCPWLPRRSRWPVFAFLSVAAFSLCFTQQRSLVAALLVGAACLAAGAWAWGSMRPLALSRLIVGAALAGVALWVLKVTVGPPTPAPFLGPVRLLFAKTASTVETGAAGTPEFTGTARFRRDAWEEAWRRFRQRPLLGEGFGYAFVFFDTGQRKWWTQDVRPHNSYLTVLYKMGLLGTGILAAILVVFYKMVYAALRKGLPLGVRSCILAGIGALVGLQFYGFFNLLLESPFMAVVFWSAMGTVASLMRLGVVEPFVGGQVEQVA